MIGDGEHSTNQRRHTFVQDGVTTGFFTDPTVCIGCKACEVACKEWNHVPADGHEWTGLSYDNTQALGASTWRHVMFLEQTEHRHAAGAQFGPVTAAAGAPQQLLADDDAAADGGDMLRWQFVSDVCKHCEVAGCLDACPTGSIVRTENGAVFVQDDVCNGCGYCVVGCPFGVIDKREKALPGGGGAFKCTFCYDRQADGLTPACAKACPTESIQFGPLDELRQRAHRRVQQLVERGHGDAHVYDPTATSVRGTHSIFLLLGSSEAYNLPRRPFAPRELMAASWTAALLTSAAGIVGTVVAFLLGAS